MIKHETRACNSCGAMQTVKVRKPNHILHIILSIVTGGFWLIVYAAAAIESIRKITTKCGICGVKMK